jgi:hypothetical protein
MRITQSQPTVSATLVHHVARGSIVLRPNIKRVCARSVEFDDGRCAGADVIVFATGYKISFPFLSPEIAGQILPDPTANEISLYHNVFHPRRVLRCASTSSTARRRLRHSHPPTTVQRISQHRRPNRLYRPHPAVLRRALAHG